jgi:hypothetical protein
MIAKKLQIAHQEHIMTMSVRSIYKHNKAYELCMTAPIFAIGSLQLMQAWAEGKKL